MSPDFMQAITTMQISVSEKRVITEAGYQSAFEPTSCTPDSYRFAEYRQRMEKSDSIDLFDPTGLIHHRGAGLNTDLYRSDQKFITRQQDRQAVALLNPFRIKQHSAPYQCFSAVQNYVFISNGSAGTTPKHIATQFYMKWFMLTLNRI